MPTEYHLLVQGAPIQGLDVSGPEFNIPHSSFPDGKNILIEDGLLVNRKGYTQLLAGISGISSGRVMEGVEYGDSSGNLHFLIAATDKVIEYASGPTWTDRTGGSLTCTVDNAVFMSPVGGAALDNLYITNGVDPVKVWTGSGNVSNLTTTGFTTFRSKCLLGFKGHLLHGNVTEDSSPFPYRIRFSAVSDPTQYNPASDTTTGFRNLVEDVGNSKVQTMLPIKEAIAVYKEKAIYIMTYEGSGSLFVPFLRIADRGAISPKSVCPVLDGNTHMVVSQDNIFLFDGFNFQVPPIGDRIKKDFYADLNWSKRGQVFCLAFPQRFEAWIMYPRTGSSNPNAAYCWNWLYNSWSSRILFNDSHNCFINLVDTLSTPTALMGISQNVVKLFDGNADIATAIDWYLRTKLHDWSDIEPEFVIKDKTTMRIEMDYAGTAPRVQIGIANNSMDAPSFETASTLTDTAVGLPKADSRHTGLYVCLKVSDNSTNPQCRINRYKIFAAKRGRT